MSELATEVKSFSKELKYEPLPILEKAWEVIKQWELKPLLSFEGVDLTELTKRIEKPLMTCRMEHFYTDKCEKIHLGWFYYMGPRMTQTFVICPSNDYDLPMFIADLDERARGSSLILDLWPTLDLCTEEWYREKYYDDLAPLYSKYWDLGPQKIIFHKDLTWWRIISSPYQLNIELSLDRRDVLTEMFEDYLKYYAGIYKKAEPIKDPKIKEYVMKRKHVQRRWSRAKDPAKGVLIRTLGIDLERKITVSLL